MALILIIIILITIRICLLTNVITTLMLSLMQHFLLFSFNIPSIQMRMHNYIPRGSINEYTYENGVQFKIQSL